MVFSSLLFLFLFLPAVLAGYYLAPPRHRNAVLLCFSYLFYLWGAGAFLFLLMLSTLVNYALGLLIDRRSGPDARRPNAHRWLAAALLFNLSILATFKYANFLIGEINKGLAVLDLPPLFWAGVALPLGISFFTFHQISYVVDVYRGRRPACARVVDFALYVAMFPQLVAGPIIQFHEISEQLKQRLETLQGFHQGLLRFCWGLIKKILLADSCAKIADAVFAQTGPLGTGAAWLGVFAYTLQIYFDFSAYSDMAIGLGLLFGFTFPENFHRPYSALSITDFWRRWHMTLTRFFRDYLYIPLGGNRRGPLRTYANLITVFLLCGMWHGANWTFLIWGGYHGALLILERITGMNRTEASGLPLLRRALTLLLVAVGWVFFRAHDLGQAADLLGAMFRPAAVPTAPEIMETLNNRNLFFLALSGLVFLLPREFSGAKLLLTPRPLASAMVQAGVLLAVTAYGIALLASEAFNPFIYFRF
ncbi:MAG: MBOAT family protein [Nitrospirae bacterium]|nr:MBOAT family protein [Nitrospirota bacterium]